MDTVRYNKNSSMDTSMDTVRYSKNSSMDTSMNIVGGVYKIITIFVGYYM